MGELILKSILRGWIQASIVKGREEGQGKEWMLLWTDRHWKGSQERYGISFSLWGVVGRYVFVAILLCVLLIFFPYRRPFNSSCNTGLVAVSSFGFCVCDVCCGLRVCLLLLTTCPHAHYSWPHLHRVPILPHSTGLIPFSFFGLVSGLNIILLLW